MLELLQYLGPVVFIVVIVLVHRMRRDRVRRCFEFIAKRHRGYVAESSPVLYPRLVIPLGNGVEAQISGIHGSSNGGSTRTFCWVGCKEYPLLKLDIRRARARIGLQCVRRARPDTGDAEFDEAFWLDTDDRPLAAKIVDEQLRRALLDLDPKLFVALRVGEAPAYRDGRLVFGEKEARIDISLRKLPPEAEDVERLVELAQLVHERLFVAGSRRCVGA